MPDIRIHLCEVDVNLHDGEEAMITKTNPFERYLFEQWLKYRILEELITADEEDLMPTLEITVTW